jgi:hypothetical protein
MLIIPKNSTQKEVIKGSKNEKKWIPGFLRIRRKINKRLIILPMGITSLIMAGSFLIANSDSSLFSVVSASSVIIFKPIKQRLKIRKTNKYTTGRSKDSLIIIR